MSGNRASSPILSVAPMMAVTDRAFRVFARCLSRRTLLYTEMIHAEGVLRGDRERLIGFDPVEHPIALQLGGSEPRSLAAAARIAQERGYDEVNLNVGCPSERVQDGRFGACLMKEPALVAEAVDAMRAATSIPITVKHRIGVDDRDRYEDMLAFVDAVAAAGADRFTVHARKAWLQGLSPKENRTVPPLRHGEVDQLKAERPELTIEINGGIRSLAEAEAHLGRVDAVMMGRAIADDPWILGRADSALFGADDPAATPQEAAWAFLPWLEARVAAGEPLQRVARHLLPLFAGRPGGRRWRQELSESAFRAGGLPVLRSALERMAAA